MIPDKSSFSVIKLYRDCLRLADYISTQVPTFAAQGRRSLPAPPHAPQPALLGQPGIQPGSPRRCPLPPPDSAHAAVRRLPTLPTTAGRPSITLQGGSRAILRDQVRQAFKKNKEETDPQKIEEQKEA